MHEPSEVMHVLRAAVASAIQAPSTHNTQPWRFRIVADRLELLVDMQRHLPVIDPECRQLMMSCGCALLNARVATRALGYADEVSLMLVDAPDPAHIATLQLGDKIVTAESDHALLHAIGLRRTNRKRYLDRAIPQEVVDALQQTVEIEGAWMVRLDSEQKNEIAKIVDDADHTQLSDPAFLHELGNWLTTPTDRRRDGIPFAEKEYGSSRPFARWRALRSHDLGDRAATAEHSNILSSPCVVVIGTNGDDPIDWLRCGQALQAMLLHATHLGLSAAFLNQCLEVPELRGRVHQLLGHTGVPQLILRIGYATEPVDHPAPRRDIADVLHE